MQLVCNYHGNVMLMSFFINSSKFDMLHHCNFWMKIMIFEILISTIHYDCSFMMVLNCEMWHSQKLPCGILIEFFKKNLFK